MLNRNIYKKIINYLSLILWKNNIKNINNEYLLYYSLDENRNHIVVKLPCKYCKCPKYSIIPSKKKIPFTMCKNCHMNFIYIK